MWVQMRGRKAWASSQPQTQFDNRLVSESLGDGVCYAGLLNARTCVRCSRANSLSSPPGWYHSTCHLDETTASIRYRKLVQCPTIGICGDPEARMRREEAGRVELEKRPASSGTYSVVGTFGSRDRDVAQARRTPESQHSSLARAERRNTNWSYFYSCHRGTPCAQGKCPIAGMGCGPCLGA